MLYRLSGRQASVAVTLPVVNKVIFYFSSFKYGFIVEFKVEAYWYRQRPNQIRAFFNTLLLFFIV